MNLVQEFTKKYLNNMAKKVGIVEGKEDLDNNKIENFTQREKNLNIGDLVKVHYKIIEGKRERIQIFEGNVISIKGNGLSRSFIVRKTSNGVGVERTFPIYSPNIAKIELLRHGKVRRAKLYYIRDRKGKSAIIKEKINFKNITDNASKKVKKTVTKESAEKA